MGVPEGALAAVFLATGLTKLTQPRERMAAGFMTWAADVTDAQFRTIGALEVAGALGLVLPGLLGVAEGLEKAAAVGLALTMVGAIATHARLREYDRVAPPVLLLGLAVYAAAAA